MESFLTILVFLFLLFIWAIIGFFIWIPLLFRTAIAFSVALTQSALIGTDLTRFTIALNHAKLFYITGFSQLREKLFPTPQYGQNRSYVTKPYIINNAGFPSLFPSPSRLLAECAWAIVFWIITLQLSGLVNFIGLLTKSFRPLIFWVMHFYAK